MNKRFALHTPGWFALLLTLFWLVSANTAWAHAQLLQTQPADGAVLDRSPTEIVLRFNEDVGLITFNVVDIHGIEIAPANAARADGDTLHLTIPVTLPRGSYVVTYRVVSADTHPVGGSYAFAVGAPTVAAPPAGADPWLIPVLLVRWALYISVLMAAGSALFVIFVPSIQDAATARTGRIAAGIGILSYALVMGVGGADLGGGGPRTLLSSVPWTAAAKTTLGLSASIGIPGLVLLILAFGRRSRFALAAGAVLALGGFVVTGHAATAEPVFVMAPAVFMHLLGTAFWMGALYPLFRIARPPLSDTGREAIVHFSRIAVVAVAGIVLTGAIITLVQVQRIGAFTDTAYGARLAVKLIFFVLLLVLAALNKYGLTEKLAKRGPLAGYLRRSIAVEFVIYMFILGAAASLTVTPPPRALSPAVNRLLKRTVTDGTDTAAIEVTPDHPGENMFMVSVRDKQGNPVVLSGMTLRLTLPSAGIAEFEKRGEKTDGITWHFMTPETIVAGDWNVKIAAFRDDFDQITFETTLPIR